MTASCNDRLIPVRDVSAIIGVGRSSIYKLIARGRFPKPIKIGKSARFSERECHEWVATRVAEREGAP